MSNLRHFDVATNRYREAERQENFKKHVVDLHSKQTLQVQERQLQQQLIQNMAAANSGNILRNPTAKQAYRDHMRVKQAAAVQAQKDLAKVRPKKMV